MKEESFQLHLFHLRWLFVPPEGRVEPKPCRARPAKPRPQPKRHEAPPGRKASRRPAP